MKLKEACRDILTQLSGLLSQIKTSDYNKPITSLNDATIGQHIRHTIEFFTCLMFNYQKGVINYDEREHDRIIEIDKEVALEIISKLHRLVDSVNGNPALSLHVNYDLSKTEDMIIETNLERELAYNIEHAIHHMAIIKIGINEIGNYIKIPTHFGVAISTVRFRKLEIS